MVGKGNPIVFTIQIDASRFAEFEISEFEISRFDCTCTLVDIYDNRDENASPTTTRFYVWMSRR